jgi:hypothetical protein
MLAWTIFVNPVHLPSGAALWMVIPLCVSVALTYKAIRVHDIRRLPREAAGLLLYMVGGLLALGAMLWALLAYWPH